MTRCDLCGLPMESEGQTGYCSERCLMWDFFGVPALKEDGFITEIRQNQRRQTVPDGWTPPEAYPALSGGTWQKEIREALALLKITCNES
jgi:hypothetical protein